MKTLLRIAVPALFVASTAFATGNEAPQAPITETPAPVAAPELSAAPGAPAALAPLASPATVVPARKPSRPLSPLAIAMNAVVESEKVQIEKLQARLATAKDHASAEAVQREIEQVKFDSEIQLLTLQATNHRQNGRNEAAARIEESIRSLRELNQPAALRRPASTTTHSTAR